MRVLIFILGLFFSIIAWVSDNITVVNECSYYTLFIIALAAVFLSMLSWRYLFLKRGWLWFLSFLFIFNGVSIIVDIFYRLYFINKCPPFL